MNIRTYIVKALYPICSDEVQILIDQMQNSPSKFTEMFDDTYHSSHSSHPWAKALVKGNFELIDHVALRQQLMLLKNVHAKQLILEGLFANESNKNNKSENGYYTKTQVALAKKLNISPEDYTKIVNSFNKLINTTNKKN